MLRSVKNLKIRTFLLRMSEKAVSKLNRHQAVGEIGGIDEKEEGAGPALDLAFTVGLDRHPDDDTSEGDHDSVQVDAVVGRQRAHGGAGSQDKKDIEDIRAEDVS